MRPLMHDSSTDVFVDGFPRSANSFAFYAYTRRSNGLTVSGHTHSAAQVCSATRSGVPVIILLRDPNHLIPSLVQYVAGLSVERAAWAYIRFHETIMPVIPRVQVAHFDEVTGDAAKTIHATNRLFSLSLDSRPFEVNELDAISRTLHATNRRYGRGGARTLPSPTGGRKSAEEILDGVSSRALHSVERAHNTYLQAVSAAGGRLHRGQP